MLIHLFLAIILTAFNPITEAQSIKSNDTLKSIDLSYNSVRSVNQSFNTVAGPSPVIKIIGGCPGTEYWTGYPILNCVAGNVLQISGSYLTNTTTIQIGKYNCPVVNRPYFEVDCKLPVLKEEDLGTELQLFITTDQKYPYNIQLVYACPLCGNTDEADNAVFRNVGISFLVIVIVCVLGCILFCVIKYRDRNSSEFDGMHVQRQNSGPSIALVMPMMQQPMMQPMMNPGQQSDNYAAPQPIYQPPAPYNLDSPPTKVIEVTDPTAFRRYLGDAKQKKQLVVVDYYATWCPPCRMIAPEMDKLSLDNPNTMFLKIDVDRLQILAQGADVNSMPTFAFWKNNTIVDRVEGADLQLIIAKCEKWSK